jgi:hypothetical protein
MRMSWPKDAQSRLRHAIFRYILEQDEFESLISHLPEIWVQVKSELQPLLDAWSST